VRALMSRRMLLGIASATLPNCLARATAQASGLDLFTTPASVWPEITAHATSFISRERQAGTLPFALRRAYGVRSKGDRIVFIDYFPPMPLSFHNLPTLKDSYEGTMLRSEAYDGRFARVGAYISERPLAVDVWQSPYWRQINLAIDIMRAAEIGADGFLIDVLRLPPGPAWSTVMALYETVAHVQPGFSVAAVIDHAGLPYCSSEQITEALVELSQKAAAFRIADGRMLITAFAPERRPASLWRDVVSAMVERKQPIAFMPIFLNTNAASDFIPFSYGLSTWGERDPVAVKSSISRSHMQLIAGASHIWMQPVAPQDVRPKVGAFWEANGLEAFRAAWCRAIEDNATFIHLITWNDYSEATEIEPSTGTQYVFFDMSAYFIEWFKTNTAPKITTDAIYYLQRKGLIDLDHPKSEIPFALRGETPLQNIVQCIAYLTAPATIEVEIGGITHRIQASEGLQVCSVGARIGRPRYRILRHGQTVLSLESQWSIKATEPTPEPLYVGGSSNRPFSK
jgi:Glycosyl hydrolase family 71